jgi:hypothetical protein
MSKFIQIASDNEYLFALDDKGQVWRYDDSPFGRRWTPLSVKRQMQANEKKKKITMGDT